MRSYRRTQVFKCAFRGGYIGKPWLERSLHRRKRGARVEVRGWWFLSFIQSKHRQLIQGSSSRLERHERTFNGFRASFRAAPKNHGHARTFDRTVFERKYARQLRKDKKWTADIKRILERLLLPPCICIFFKYDLLRAVVKFISFVFSS